MSFQIKDADKKRIEEALQKAEAKTTGEIVPMVLSKSDLYPAAHFRLAILCAMSVSMIMYYIPWQFNDPIWYLWAQIPALILGHLLAYNHKIKRFFSTGAELDEEVHQKAIQSFFYNNLHHTNDRTGILIMVSLLEHRVEVLADSGINAKVEKGHWDNLTKNLIKEIKGDRLLEGLIHAVEECGELLSKHFPAQEENPNELPDSLITE